MTIRAWIEASHKKLKQSEIASARLDTELILADTLGRNRAWLLAYPEHTLQDTTLETLNRQVERRASHEPMAYIRGKQEFYGRGFIVSPSTLTPRPETETMIELLLEHARNKKKDEPLHIIDIGTGSGCIIITAALELANNKNTYTGLDVSPPALKIAKQNAKSLGATISFQQFDLRSESLQSTFGRQPAIYLCNLPYVPDTYPINKAAKHEPGIALFGGTDGLDYYRALFTQIKNQNCTVLTESLSSQHEALAEIALKHGFTLSHTKDLIQVFIPSN